VEKKKRRRNSAVGLDCGPCKDVRRSDLSNKTKGVCCDGGGRHKGI